MDLTPDDITLLRLCFHARIQAVASMKGLTRTERENEMSKVELLAKMKFNFDVYPNMKGNNRDT
jgi:hypothetical protein